MIGILVIVLVYFLFIFVFLMFFCSWRVGNGFEGLEFWEFGIMCFCKGSGRGGTVAVQYM